MKRLFSLFLCCWNRIVHRKGESRLGGQKSCFGMCLVCLSSSSSSSRVRATRRRRRGSAQAKKGDGDGILENWRNSLLSHSPPPPLPLAARPAVTQQKDIASGSTCAAATVSHNSFLSSSSSSSQRSPIVSTGKFATDVTLPPSLGSLHLPPSLLLYNAVPLKPSSSSSSSSSTSWSAQGERE